jgi:N-acetylglucosamine kinase
MTALLAAGIDLGGTKIEAQIFDSGWNRVTSQRIATPSDYPALVDATVGLIAWIEAQCLGLPIGIAAAGLVNPRTGLTLAVNLAAHFKPFPADIAAKSARPVLYMNDSRAQALSEARFGAGRGYVSVLTLNFGTGLSGGYVSEGHLLPGPSGLAGEFGHFALPAPLMQTHALPVLPCGCGRSGCTETLLSGPGLSRIVAHRTGRQLSALEIVSDMAKDADLAVCWQIWCELVGDLIHTLCLTLDPACIVLGGGLSRAPGLIADLTRTATAAALPGYGPPPILLAEGGDATGARGAALAAFLKEHHDAVPVPAT